MEFRVLNWNMGKVSTSLADRLRTILATHAPHVLLTQESHSPFHYVPEVSRGTWTSCLWRPKLLHKPKSEGCAIIAPKLVIDEIDSSRLQGWVTIGVAALPVGQTAIVSLHAPTHPKDHDAFGLLGRTCGTWMMEVAMPYIEACVARYDNVVIGADTNCSRHIAQRLGNAVYREAHECMSTVYGYTEALYICSNRREMPTWRKSRLTAWSVPNDHLFVKGPLADRLKASNVVLNPDPPGDHAPVLTIFEF